LLHAADAQVRSRHGLTTSALRRGLSAAGGPSDVLSRANGIAERVGLKTEGVQNRVEDPMTEDADWY
jgi:hypothetical protein